MLEMKEVRLPECQGRITTGMSGGKRYVYYLLERTYHKDKKYNTARRISIGRLSEHEGYLVPNQNFILYFSDALHQEEEEPERSNCLRAGSWMALGHLAEQTGVKEILENSFNAADAALILDFASYLIVMEDNAGQYYPDYAYNHPLFSPGMRICSDSSLSLFLKSVRPEQIAGFINGWNGRRRDRKRIYISYDSTNRNCQAGEVRLVEFGKPKTDTGEPVINTAVAYDCDNREALFYEEYPGSINDVSQLRFMVDKARSFGYRDIGFILDRGYFSKGNIRSMDASGFAFIIMLKGKEELVREMVDSVRHTFEDRRSCFIKGHGVNGTTIRRRLYEDDDRDRHFHLYHSTELEASERSGVEERIGRLSALLDRHLGKPYQSNDIMERYFDIAMDKTGRNLLAYQEKSDVIEAEIRRCGYFVIVTSEKMTAAEALGKYRGRDASEKLFRSGKSFLDSKSLRVASDEAVSAKTFIEFIALIVRQKFYTALKDAVLRSDRHLNYMSVPAALKELDKIEMSRQFDGVYRLDHAVTKRQRTILDALGLDDEFVKRNAREIGNALKPADAEDAAAKEVK